MLKRHPLVIVTDLDGSLLNHDDYSFKDANEALYQLSKRDIPLIFNTSKSKSEVAALRERLNNHHPYIIENGACAVIPKNYFNCPLPAELTNQPFTTDKAFGRPISEFLPLLYRLKKAYGLSFQGFSEMSHQQIAAVTGLTANEAIAAGQRDYSEPIQWLDSEFAWLRFAAILKQHHLQYLQGGRFISISAGGDKGQAMTWLRSLYAEHYGLAPYFIALGDSGNDISMLQAADYPVVIRSPHKAPIKIPDRDDVHTTELTGAAGWNQAILDFLNHYCED